MTRHTARVESSRVGVESYTVSTFAPQRVAYRVWHRPDRYDTALRYVRRFAYHAMKQHQPTTNRHIPERQTPRRTSKRRRKESRERRLRPPRRPPTYSHSSSEPHTCNLPLLSQAHACKRTLARRLMARARPRARTVRLCRDRTCHSVGLVDLLLFGLPWTRAKVGLARLGAVALRMRLLL